MKRYLFCLYMFFCPSLHGQVDSFLIRKNIEIIDTCLNFNYYGSCDVVLNHLKKKKKNRDIKTIINVSKTVNYIYCNSEVVDFEMLNIFLQTNKINSHVKESQNSCSIDFLKSGYFSFSINVNFKKKSIYGLLSVTGKNKFCHNAIILILGYFKESLLSSLDLPISTCFEETVYFEGKF